MDCTCHDAPMYWNRDSRYRGGGFWRCAVRKRVQIRDSYQRNRETRCQTARDRYDADPIYRIEKQLHDQARKRQATLTRKREALHG